MSRLLQQDNYINWPVMCDNVNAKRLHLERELYAEREWYDGFCGEVSRAMGETQTLFHQVFPNMILAARSQKKLRERLRARRVSAGGLR